MHSRVRLLGSYVAAAVLWSGCNSDGGSAGAGGGSGAGGQGGHGGGAMQCTVDAQCNDDEECTEDVCGAEGTCENTPVSDGSECADGLCVVGSCEPVAFVVPCSEEGLMQAVSVGGGPYGFACEGSKIVTTTQEVLIQTNVILDGVGGLTLDGAETHRLFKVRSGTTAELRRLSIVRGAPSEGGGGGILNEGTLTIASTTVSDNTSQTLGGGIRNTGTLTLIESVVSGNRSGAGGGQSVDGGGIYNSGPLTLRSSTISGNRTAPGGDGGGLANTGIMTMEESLVSGNEAGQNGGGISNSNALTMTNSTVSGNTAAAGGGIWNGSILNLDYCTIADNAADNGLALINQAPAVTMVANTLIDGDCSEASLSSKGYNIESPGNTCGLGQSTDSPGTSVETLQLEPLADNGGPTETHAIELTSVARDVIPAMVCDVEVDQRGVTRPQDQDCDIGAFELTAP